MPNQSTTDTNKSSEPPSDSERAQEPALPEPIYEPYAQRPLHDASYKPYSEKAALPDPPYEPYKGI
jgi:hypothetical protein